MFFCVFRVQLSDEGLGPYFQVKLVVSFNVPVARTRLITRVEGLFVYLGVRFRVELGS